MSKLTSTKSSKVRTFIPVKSGRLLSGEMEGLEVKRGTQGCHQVIDIILLDLEGSTGNLIYYY